MGDDSRLVEDVISAASQLHPRFIALCGTPIPRLMGTDLPGLARLIEKRTGIPATGFSTSGTHSYLLGASKALKWVAERFCHADLTPDRELSVNLLGVTPLDFSVTGTVEALRQLLTKNADEFVWAAELLAKMGYREVNLNVGCPSGTVVAKGKGAGFLRSPDELDTFLGEICRRSPIPVSVKTRIGIAEDGEYDEILATYRHHPLAELIVHPRVQKDRYRGVPRREPYGETLRTAPFPVAYNGDIFTCDDMDALLAAYPETRHVMLGRGILANPALARMLGGGPALTLAELEGFHDKLFCAYEAEMGGNAVFRMKEWWFYAKCSFADPLSVHRAVRKVRTVKDYRAAIERIFRDGKLADAPGFRAT